MALNWQKSDVGLAPPRASEVSGEVEVAARGPGRVLGRPGACCRMSSPLDCGVQRRQES